MKMILLMIGLHLIADFTLQGWFANGKQKRWWQEQCHKQEIDITPYQHDWIVAIVAHGLQWTLITFAPLIYLWNESNGGGWTLFLMSAMNTFVHAFVDDLKANRYAINLFQDQMLHLGQIIITYIGYLYFI